MVILLLLIEQVVIRKCIDNLILSKKFDMQGVVQRLNTI